MQLNNHQMKQFFKNKKVIILGSAPSVVETQADFINNFDIVVRLNNYKFFNECKRVDVYYSYFGMSIKKTSDDIINDNVKLIMCKYPLCDWGNAIEGHSGNWTNVYKNKRYKAVDYYIPINEYFKRNYNLLKRIQTTGLASILDILRFKPSFIYISGFDFFTSKKHNINEAWKDGDGNHDLEKEKCLIKMMLYFGLIDADNNIKNIVRDI